MTVKKANNNDDNDLIYLDISNFSNQYNYQYYQQLRLLLKINTKGLLNKMCSPNPSFFMVQTAVLSVTSTV